MTWFCSWLSSDAEADGSGQNCKARRLHWPRLHSGERRERKEFDQAHRGIYSSTGTGERAWEGSQGCAAGGGQRERAGPQSCDLRETRPVLRYPQSEGDMACVFRDPRSEGVMVQSSGSLSLRETWPVSSGILGLRETWPVSPGILSLRETWPVLRKPQYGGNMACP